MFRDCYFEYAGISSQPFNLILCYISNSSDSFDSGGKFEIKTDTVTRSYETLLYGKNYSEKPLEFEVEIINIDEAIPFNQMVEIKNWLFGQDGWKTLIVRDKRQNYCLKCILEPIEDIVDGYGYRGVRCNLRNISPFWYGEDKEIVISEAEILANTTVITTVDGYNNTITTSYSAADIFIPENDIVGFDVTPVCTLELTATEVSEEEDTTVSISNTSATSVALVKEYNDGEFDYPNTTYTAFDFSDTDTTDVVTIDTKYAIMEAQNQTIGWHNPSAFASLPIFKLHKGHNYIRMTTAGGYLSGLKIKYTPVYRLGAF